MTCGGIFVLCVFIYRKKWVIFDDMVIHFRRYKIIEERAVFLHLIDAGVFGTFLCIGYLRGFCGAHCYIIENFVSLLFSWLLFMREVS